MSGSRAFRQAKRAALVEIDEERLYIVKGDILGEEEELFVEAVLRGAAGQGELNRQIYEELDEEERELILGTFRK